jgi:hypothetical protein
MKMVKSLILGSAAGLIAMSGAQAADLPVKAKAVEYVRICSLYGAGFWYIPGTDTCMKIGGYVRADTTFNGGIQDQPAWNGDLGQVNRYRDQFTSRARMAFTVDTRTATEYGVVRTFGQADFTFDSPSALRGGAAGSSFAAEFLFIQFAGFTFGKSASAFATPWHGYPGNNSSHLLGGHDTVTGVNNIQYTAQFGNGVSGTIGLDDPMVYWRTRIGYLAPGSLDAVGFTLANAYGGAAGPDIVGNIRVDQAWGLFQISAAAHQNYASYNLLNPATGAPINTSEISGHPDSKWGGSVMAALQIKNIPTGPGDDIKIDATYAKGNTKNVISTSAASPSFAIFSGGNGGSYQSVGFGNTTDSVYVPGGNLELTTAYGVRGAFNHNWDPFWSSSLFGSYSAVRYNTNAKAAYCATYISSNKLTVANTSADFGCNPDFNVSQLGVVTRWTPVKNLTFSGEVMWFHLDQKFTGSAVLAPTFPKPTTVYNFKDQDAVSLNVRVQRNF